MANRLASIRARVAPPAYSRQPASTLEQPSNIAALIGSSITMSGPGPAAGVRAVLGKDSLDATLRDERWAVDLKMPKEPAVLTLLDRAYRRLAVLEPRTDSAPAVQLRPPANDTAYQTVPKGKLTIEAGVSDDIGLAYGYVEYMLSTGSQESFDTKLSVGPRLGFGNARKATLREVIDLDTMKLAPGSVLHIRTSAPSRSISTTSPAPAEASRRPARSASPSRSTRPRSTRRHRSPSTRCGSASACSTCGPIR